MKDTNWLMVALCIIGSLVVAIIISTLVVRSELEPYKELKWMKDSLSVQHNHFYFTIEKDTIITQKVCIDLSSLSQ